MSEAERDAAVGRAGASAGVRAFWEQAGTLGLALLIAVGIRAFAFEPFRIPSGSMFPTLLIGDHLFVNKFVYGIKIPFGEARLPGIRAPERGDIAVFTVARDGSETIPADRRPELPREEFVKRIIGLPGDRIAFRDGEVFVNGERVEAMDSGEVFEDDYGRHLEIREVALGERRFRIPGSGSRRRVSGSSKRVVTSCSATTATIRRTAETGARCAWPRSRGRRSCCTGPGTSTGAGSSCSTPPRGGARSCAGSASGLRWTDRGTGGWGGLGLPAAPEPIRRPAGSGASRAAGGGLAARVGPGMLSAFELF